MSLGKLFYDLNKPEAYCSTSILKRKGGKEFLSKQDAFTLHHRYRKNFKRRKVIGGGLNNTVHADLADMQNIKRDNKGVGYILVVVDCYSRTVFLQPVKRKTAEFMTKAIKQVFTAMRRRFGYICSNFVSDRGTEFYQRQVKDLFNSQNINHYSTFTEMKACMAERMIRTVKGRLYKYFTHTGKYKWLHVLQQIATAINNTVNRSIKKKPIDVQAGDVDEEQEEISREAKKHLSKKFKVDDPVRVSKIRGTFDKSYVQSWTDEVFYVSKVKLNFKPPYLKLRDYQGNELDGIFYFQECQKITEPDAYRIEKVLRRRTRNGVKQAFVKWMGYSNEHNSWINASDVVKF